MQTETHAIHAPPMNRALQGIAPDYQVLITERYQRIGPILMRLLRPRDILERNRTWPGVSPKGKKSTSLLQTKHARQVRRCIKEYSAATGDDTDELWLLLRAYLRFGPIGLVEALPSSLPPLVPDALQECANFHILAKHPRSDAGVYIRQILDTYADDLHLPRLPRFVARYAFAARGQTERWFFPKVRQPPISHERTDGSIAA